MTQRVFYHFENKWLGSFGPQWGDTRINNYYENINKYGNPIITALYMSQQIKLIFVPKLQHYKADCFWYHQI